MHAAIPDKLGFMCGDPAHISANNFKHLARELKYVTSDFHSRRHPLDPNSSGPANLAVIYRFCRFMCNRIVTMDETMIIYYSEPQHQKTANAIFLISSYLHLQLDYSLEHACEWIRIKGRALLDFKPPSKRCRDIDVIDYMSGLAKGRSLGWFDLKTFDLELFETLELPSAGTIHQVSPRLIAFKAPAEQPPNQTQGDDEIVTVDDLIPTFRRLGVTCVVRLSDVATYDGRLFERGGIRHVDLGFGARSTPPDRVAARFLEVCAQEAVVAVHCEDGLGRTGTMVALRLMRQDGFSAREAVAWARVVRPGSAAGPQQLRYLLAEQQPRHPSHLRRRAGPAVRPDGRPAADGVDPARPRHGHGEGIAAASGRPIHAAYLRPAMGRPASIDSPARARDSDPPEAPGRVAPRVRSATPETLGQWPRGADLARRDGQQAQPSVRPAPAPGPALAPAEPPATWTAAAATCPALFYGVQWPRERLAAWAATNPMPTPKARSPCARAADGRPARAGTQAKPRPGPLALPLLLALQSGCGGAPGPARRAASAGGGRPGIRPVRTGAPCC